MHLIAETYKSVYVVRQNVSKFVIISLNYSRKQSKPFESVYVAVSRENLHTSTLFFISLLNAILVDMNCKQKMRISSVVFNF